MKFFKKIFLVIPMLFSLASCSGEKSAVGTYSFQLGSNTGTHAGIHLLLTDDAVEATGRDDAKRFTLNFDLGAGANSGIFGIVTHLHDIIDYIDTHSVEEIPDSIDDIIDIISKKTEGEPEASTEVNGYYYFKQGKNALGKDETRLMLGFDIDNIPFFEGESIDIPPEIVEMILYATYDNDTVNIIVPVSIEDLLFQIYWYGYRIDGLRAPVHLHDENKYIVDHEVGTHPTADDVTTIQEYQKDRETKHPDDYGEFEFIYSNYHDYHTLTMGLAKDGN